MIDQETIEQVRQASDIVQIVDGFARLKKRGKNHWAVCPFHQEKSPSFKVSVDSQLFYCFGCGKGGNVFTFLMEHEKMSFVEAVRFLAQKANIAIRESGSDFKREQMERINFAHEVAVDYFQKQLRLSKFTKVLIGYLKESRGMTDEAIEHFQLGLSTESWDGLLSYAKTKSLSSEDMEQAGLALRSETRGTYFDRFRQRLMIPIFNISRKPIAFGGRTLKKGEPAKYINSPETALYHKSNVLYGLNFARDHIRDTGDVIVVEGYFDVISLWQVGIRNVVASSGTAFTTQQARLLKRFAENVFLFFDADSAGEKAALRSVDALFDAGLDVKVMLAPDGEDPDSLARKEGAESIEALRADALSYLPFRVRRIDVEKSGLMAREKLIKELSTLATRIGDPTRRSLFIQEAAQITGVEESLLKGAATAEPARTETPRASHSARHKVEMNFLSLLLRNPGSIDQMFETVAPDDFDSRQLARLYGAISTQYQMDGLVNANRLIQNFEDEESISLLSEIAAMDIESDRIEVDAHEATRTFVEQKKKATRRRLANDLKDAEAKGDNKRADEILEEMKRYGL